jgi:hypothetical protein
MCRAHSASNGRIFANALNGGVGATLAVAFFCHLAEQFKDKRTQKSLLLDTAQKSEQYRHLFYKRLHPYTSNYRQFQLNRSLHRYSKTAADSD